MKFQRNQEEAKDYREDQTELGGESRNVTEPTYRSGHGVNIACLAKDHRAHTISRKRREMGYHVYLGTTCT